MSWLPAIVLVALLGFVLWRNERERQRNSEQLIKLIVSHSNSLMDMAEKIKTPDSMAIEAIRAQAAPIIPQKDEAVLIDEAWLSSEDSELPLTDDLSPVFDAEEGLE